MNRHFSNYSLHELATNVGDFKTLLDTANEKYNNTIWKQFATVLPASNSKRFSTIVEEANIVVKASMLGSTAKKPLRSFEGGKAHGDSIHKIGHGFKVDQDDIDNIIELNLIGGDIAYQMVKRYLNRARAIIGGFHATWNSWIFEALSNQEIVLKSQDTTLYTVDMGVPDANKLVVEGTAKWFDEDSTKYNIIKDLLRMDKVADDDACGMPSNRALFVPKALLQKVLVDPTVIAALKARMVVFSPDNLILTDRYVLNQISATFGLPPIVAIDEKSRIEKDGIPQVDSASFNQDKVILAPTMPLFNMHNSPSDYQRDANPGTIKTFTEGGLIGAIQLYASDPYSVVTNMESWSFFGFKNPKWLVSLDTGKYHATGLASNVA